VTHTAPERASEPGRRLWRSRAERRADAARALIDEQRARHQAERERLETETEHARLRAQLDEQATTAAAKRRDQRRTLRQRISLAVVLAAANIGVNAAAVLGQILALMYGLNWEWWQAVPLAVVVESVAVNVGYLAHDKMIKGFSAYGLRLLSYAIGVGVGAFNYSHNSGLTETAEFAGVFGAASILSPVLWQIYSQWRHWESMREQGLLEQRPLRFPLLRWVIPSLRSETWAAFKHGVAEGLRSPDAALAEVRAGNATGNAERALRIAQQQLIAVQSDALQLSLTHLTAVAVTLPVEDPARKRFALLAQRFHPIIPPLPPGQLLADSDPTDDPEEETEPETGEETRRPSDQDNDAARAWVKQSITRRKTVPSAQAVADEFRFSKKWGWERVNEAKKELAAKGWTFPDDGPPVSPAVSRKVSVPVPAAAVNGSTNGNAKGGA